MPNNTFFEKEARRYNSRYEGFTLNLYEKVYQRKRLNMLIGMSRFYEQGKILDAGCGSGNLLFEMRKNTMAHLVGLDLSKNMVSIAKSKNIPNSDFFIGSVTNIKQKSNLFDCVYCIGVLPYLDEITPAIKEMRRVLKDKGYCVVSYPYENFFVNFFRKNPLGLFIRKNILKMASYEVKYTLPLFEETCRKKGFKILEKKRLRFSECLYIMKKTKKEV